MYLPRTNFSGVMVNSAPRARGSRFIPQVAMILFRFCRTRGWGIHDSSKRHEKDKRWAAVSGTAAEKIL
jgi:hypothetical protein